MRVGEIFKEAIRKNASALIVIQNHPGGDFKSLLLILSLLISNRLIPNSDVNWILHINNDDVAVTRAIVQAGKQHGCGCVRHMVIGQGKWVSLKEMGLGFA